jgi:peptide/nickel transport system permease protein
MGGQMIAPTESSGHGVKRRTRDRRGGLRGILLTSKAALGACVLLVVTLSALLPGLVAPYAPNDQFLANRLKPPLTGFGTAERHLFGTDQLGRDILSRVIYSARTSVIIGLMVVLVSGTIGVTVGMLSGYLRGIVDDALMRLAEIQLAFPFLLLAIAIIGVLGNSVWNVILAVSVANWVVYARVVRGETLAVREKVYVEAARSMGATTLRVVLWHILPNVSPSIIVISTFGVANAILAEAGLSFLGLGVPLSVPTWGSMLADGRRFVDTSWWLAVFPGIAIFSTVLAINLVGDYLRDILDPYFQVRRALQQQ